ncbi:MAG TPA: ABC transporter permease [Candidatus Acidoferrales bacterium]|nr:ABC transporter permease [Candidatus Acidoferrales bacterium]
MRNPRRKLLTAAALVVGMAVATATLSVALEVGDRMAREFRSLGANLLVTPQSDSLPLEIGGVDYRPVDEGAYISEANLGKIKTIFWRHNVLGFTPFLDVPVTVRDSASPNSSAAPGSAKASSGAPGISTTLIGTWYEHPVPIPDGTNFVTGAKLTHPYWKIQGSWFHDSVATAAVGRKQSASLSSRAERIQRPGRVASAVEGSASAFGLSSGAEGQPAAEAVVGTTFAATYPGGITPGKTIYVDANGKQIALRVTGIVSTGDAEDLAILVPLSVAQTLSGHPGQFRQLFVSALTKPADSLSERDPKSLTPTEYDRWFCSPYISSISYQIGQVLPGTDIRVIRRVADSEGKILSRISTLLWIVTLAALVAAGLAVAATSATSVLQRRAEIGIMKAIGATNALVGSIFLTEQLLLALAGGTVGFALGLILARVLGTSVFGTPAEPRLILLPIILGLAALVAIAGSLIPLRRAARFDPVPILRGE